jgi:hypothetical protein
MNNQRMGKKIIHLDLLDLRTPAKAGETNKNVAAMPKAMIEEITSPM